MIALAKMVGRDPNLAAAAQRALDALASVPSFLAAANIVSRAPDRFILVGGESWLMQPLTREQLGPGLAGAALYRDDVARLLTRQGLVKVSAQIAWWRADGERARLMQWLVMMPGHVMAVDAMRLAETAGVR